jgi:hypothetical protein
MTGRVLRLELPIESEEELSALRAALLAARASELAEMRRRGARHGFGYGDEGARESMTAEAAHAHGRWAMLDRLIARLDEAAKGVE